jgi:hypothetical protein
MRIEGTKDCWVGFEKSVEEEKLVDQQGWTLRRRWSEISRNSLYGLGMDRTRTEYSVL